jgi:chromosome segregation ATPase
MQLPAHLEAALLADGGALAVDEEDISLEVEGEAPAAPAHVEEDEPDEKEERRLVKQALIKTMRKTGFVLPVDDDDDEEEEEEDDDRRKVNEDMMSTPRGAALRAVAGAEELGQNPGSPLTKTALVLEGLEAEIARVSAMLGDKVAEFNAMTTEMEGVRAQLDEANARAARSEADSVALRGRVGELEAREANLAERLARVEDELQALKAQALAALDMHQKVVGGG